MSENTIWGLIWVFYGCNIKLNNNLFKNMPEKEKEEIQIGIYKIDKALFSEQTDDEIISSIVESYNKKQPDVRQFKEQEINQEYHNFTVRVFFSTKTQPPRWRSFLKDVLKDSEPLLRGMNTDVSYMAMIYNQENMFAISGGQGNFTIQDYIDQNFGIDILTRLISKDSKVIKSLHDRGVTGSILGSTKFFRGDYKLSDEDEFGKIYKQIMAELNPKILCEEFGFSEEQTKRNSGCLAKTSFQINKSINFISLLRIIEKINDLLKNHSPKFSLNKVSLIPRRGKGNKELIDKLETMLITKLFNYCSNEEEIDFDFCHPSFEEYLTANNYKVFKGSSTKPIFESSERLDNLKNILGEFKSSNDISLEDENKFFKDIENINIVSYDAEGKPRTRKKFIGHIHGEIACEDKIYFFIDGEWYVIDPNFVEELNEDCKFTISNSIEPDILPDPFNCENEDEYNKLYLNRDGYLILHKVLHENIEFCDIIHSKENKIYVIHVKKTFDNSMRDLISQVLISAKRLARDIKSDKSFLITIENKVKNGKTIGGADYSQKIKSQNILDKGIVELFNTKNSNIIFCLGILDTSPEDRNFSEDIKKYKSNIAKFSILELEKQLRSLGFGFAIAHVKKTFE